MVINFNTFDEMWMDAIYRTIHGDVVESRVGGSREILGYSARLTDLSGAWLFNQVRRASPHYAAGELLWYLRGTDRLDVIQEYAPSYSRFSDDGKTLYGAYGYRIYLQGGFDKIPHILRTSPTSRQAVINMWGHQDLYNVARKKSKDIPCTLSLQYLLRDGKLNCVATMRSNDVWLGMPYDVFCFTAIQRIFADALNVQPGWYQHNVGSMHLYDKNFEKAQESIANGYDLDKLDTSYPEGCVYPDNVQAALDKEESFRVHGVMNDTFDKLGEYGILSSVVRMAACYKDPIRFVPTIRCKALREYSSWFYGV